VFKTNCWRAQVPDAWAVDANTSSGELVTLYSPSGYGMLQLAVFGKPYDGAGVGEPFRGKLTGKYYAGRVYRGTFQRSWHLNCKGLTLSVTYRCAEHNATLEQPQVDEIVSHIEENDGAAA